MSWFAVAHLLENVASWVAVLASLVGGTAYVHRAVSEELENRRKHKARMVELALLYDLGSCGAACHDPRCATQPLSHVCHNPTCLGDFRTSG